jgi:DNA-binding CsgD family transcriptional regulator
MNSTSTAVAGKLQNHQAQVHEMDLMEVVSKRSVPGILVFDHKENLVSCNPVAKDILTELSGTRDPSLKNDVDITIPKEIYNLYRSLKEINSPRHRNNGVSLPSQAALFSTQLDTYGCRGSFLQDSSSPAWETFRIMIMIERISQRHDADLETFKKRFKLTDRQMEIVKLLLAGCSNTEIATGLCVCDDTIKGHLKHIMQRLGVHSRTEILSKIIQFYYRTIPI